MKSIVNLSCEYCSLTFTVPTTEYNRNKTKYCSRKCSGASKAGVIKVTPNESCAVCHQTFHIAESKRKLSKSGLHFCSRKCKDFAQRLEQGFVRIHPSHYGTGDSSYREIAFRNFEHRCYKCSYDRYPKVLVVHHKDRNRSNNSLENLVVLCPTCHEEEHLLSESGRWTCPGKEHAISV